MQVLRNATFLARLVLAWFALSIGVAVASPLVKPVATELICSGGGVARLLATGETDGGGKVPSSHLLDCPLCVSLGAPPPVMAPPAGPQATATQTVQSIPCARPAALAAAPLPARGPPLSLFL